MKWYLTYFLLLAVNVSALEPKFSQNDINFFEKNIRPLLKDKCYRCHSHTVESKKKLKGNLFLDSRIDIIQGGNNGPAALPGKPMESQLIKYVTHEDIDERMPPKEKDWLTEKEIENLKIWIAKGMAWPKEPRPQGADGYRDLFDVEKRKSQHWAWNTLKNPIIPNIKNFPHPVDKFISEQLSKKNLKLSDKAEKSKLIRRAYLDITGLLPTQEKVEKFLNDQSPDAFEKVIDELLSSKSFGERWARHWLDLVRYAESHGHEFDYSIPHAYKYRDMVIRAYNNDVPHDQWLKDHVAGDLLKSPRIDPETGINESITATGFWYFFEASHAPVDVKEDEVLRLNNQIDTFSKTFLALTVACARCHDHKFDAITAKDFYALSGYLQSSRRQEALLDPTGKIKEAAQKIDKLKREIGSSIDNKDIESVKKYLRAASEIYSSKETTHNLGQSEIFADFENGYGEWKSAGDAFGDKPLSDQYRTGHHVTGFNQKHYVCSYHPFNSKGINPDDRRGTLTSPDFKISKNLITFLIAGGEHKNKTCVNLIIDGKKVFSQTGFNNRDLREITWDVSRFKGKSAKIEIVDKKNGGWGHITADRFIFSNSPSIYIKETLEFAEKKYSVDKEELTKWLLEFKNAYSDESHPLYLIARTSGNSFEQSISEINKNFININSRKTEFISKTKLFEDFNSDHYKNLRVTGQAFPENQTPGIIDSAYYGPKFQGVIRTKDFTIESPHIFYKISGSKVMARVIIEDYFLDTSNGLLFGGLSKQIEIPAAKPQWVRVDGDLGRYIGRRAHIEFIDHGDGSFKIEEIRFGNFNAPSQEIDSEQLKLSETQSSVELINKAVSTKLFRNWYRKQFHLFKDEGSKFQKLADQINQIAESTPSPSRVLAIVDGFPVDNYVYDRGAHAKKGIDAPRAFLEALSGPTQSPDKQGSGRLDLAEKILRDGRHFLARVQVNRIWLHLMGRGIVPTPDDFGVLGMKPTHPELLDHLALKYIELGWSNKKMIKYIMSSHTYKQTTKLNPVNVEKTDPNNNLYHRANVRRLEGEIIRDIILQSSGQLDQKMYGNSIPVHLTSFMSGRGRPGSGPLDGNGRRSIYQSVRRNFLNPFFLTFDFPIPAQSIGKRNTTNVPAQALSMLNDPFIHQQVDIVVKEIESDLKNMNGEKIIDKLFMRLYSRPAGNKEKAILQPLLKDKNQIKQLIHILFNKKEFTHVF